MKVFYATNLLNLLLYKRILKNRLDWLSLPTDYIFPWLENLDRNGESASPEELSEKHIDILINWGLVSEKPGTRLRKGKSVRPSLAFVFAVNLELSYDCNLDCNHCLQKSIRPEMAGIVMNSEKAIRILEGAWFAGLLKKGVNITGGETISKESSLIRIVEWLGSHKILFRLNTSGWWGGSENIQIGSKNFSNAGELLLWLKRNGIYSLALSFDNRLDKYPGLEESLAKIAVFCRDNDIRFEFLATGITHERLKQFYSRLSSRWNISLNMQDIPSSFDPVDIGGAVRSNQKLQSSFLVDRIHRSGCSGQCFYRPGILHISPDGGVRGCMYSPGAMDFGNAITESLPDLINRFHQRAVVRLFSEDRLVDFIEDEIKPYEEIYRDIHHPCAATVLVGRIAVDCEGLTDSADLRVSHESIARKLGLTRIPFR